MSSSVFFRFKSQKEPSRVAFDGTGISVFELKKEIITVSRLGDGTDFELIITSEDGSEEHNDDTAIIPRSTTVIAKRMPAAKMGRGGAARYVSGKMPVTAKNSHRQEMNPPKPTVSAPTTQPKTLNGAQTEEEKIQAMFKLGADQWAQDQQQMANATPIHRGGPMKGKPQNVPDHPPPPSYVCHRCGQKGHWIQACPTNSDPTFDGRPRVKRTTGIPRSFLKTVEKPTALANDGTVDDTKQPSGIMVNAEGEWVVAEPDKAAWERYQAKAKVSAEAQQAAAEGSTELRERGLECSVDKRLFADPVKTPCCEKTFCRDCITNALVDNDLKCPECSTEDVPIDDLVSDVDMLGKIQQYEEEMTAKKASTENAGTQDKSNTLGISHYRKDSLSPPPQKSPHHEHGSKKRTAESELENDRQPPGPTTSAATQHHVESTGEPTQPTSRTQKTLGQQISVSNAAMPAMSTAIMPNLGGYMGMPNMGGMGANPMFNPMMMPDPSFMALNATLWGGGLPQQGMGMPAGFQNGTMAHGGFDQQTMYHNNMVHNPMDMTAMNTYGTGVFANQQRSGFGYQSGHNEDSAYIRQPVNPYRQQGRRNVNRPADYREI